MIINNHTNDRSESLCVIPRYTLYSPDLYVIDVISKYQQALSNTYDIEEYIGRGEKAKLFYSFTRTDIDILKSIALTDNIENIDDFLCSAVNDKELNLNYLIDNCVSLDTISVVSFLSMQKYNSEICILISNKMKVIETAIIDALLQEKGIMKYNFKYYDNEDELLSIISGYTISMIPDASIVDKLIDKYDMSLKTILLPRLTWNFNVECVISEMEPKYNLLQKCIEKEIELGIVQVFEFAESDLSLG